MHSYSIDSKERQTVPFFISASTILFTWAFYWLLNQWNVALPWWVDAPSVLGFYACFYWLFDNYLWRMRLLRKAGFIKTPDLAGTWKGEIKSSFGTQRDVTMQIRQTWNMVGILLKTDESKSCSTSAALDVFAPEGPALNYQYQNNPSHASPQTMNIHYGTVQLAIENDGKKMSGEYYSGRGRQNIGSLILVKQ